jgi:glycosyltransferase involved in cell wall biosynthesis
MTVLFETDAYSPVKGAVKKTRILIFVEAFYPGWQSGGPTQSVKNITLLLNEKFDVYVVNRCRDVNTETNYPGIKVNEWMRVERFGCEVLYLTEEWVSIGRFRQIIREVDPAHIYLNSLWNRGFAMMPLAACYLLGILDRIVLNPRGELNPNAIAFKRGRKVAYATILDWLGIARKIRWNATNEIEAKLIRQRFGEETLIKILPNIPRQDQVDAALRQKPKGTLKLVFFSRITPMKNLTFLLRALKLTNPATRFELALYGPVRDEAYWAKCQALLQALPLHVVVDYRGSVVPEEVLDRLRKHHFFALPTLGENFGHAIFDAWSAGLPVLISEHTPWKELRERQLGWDLPLSEQAWSSVLDEAGRMGQKEYDELCKASLAYAVHYRYETGLPEKVEQLFREQ